MFNSWDISCTVLGATPMKELLKETWFYISLIVLSILLAFMLAKDLATEHKEQMYYSIRQQLIIDSLQKELNTRIYLDSVRISVRKIAAANRKYLEKELRWQNANN